MADSANGCPQAAHLIPLFTVHRRPVAARNPPGFGTIAL